MRRHSIISKKFQKMFLSPYFLYKLYYSIYNLQICMFKYYKLMCQILNIKYKFIKIFIILLM